MTEIVDEASVHDLSSPFGALLDLLAAELHQVTLALHPSLTDVRPFLWRRWRVRPAYTYVLDLEGREEITGGWSRGTARTFRRSRDEFEIEDGPDGVADIVDLVISSHERQEKQLGVSRATMVTLVSDLVNAGLVQPFVARRGGVAEAGIAVLTSGDEAHYWLAGSRPGPAMTVLIGSVLESLREQGVHRFDFAGANTPSVAEFKRRFGPRLAPYFIARHVSRPELRLFDRLLDRF